MPGGHSLEQGDFRLLEGFELNKLTALSGVFGGTFTPVADRNRAGFGVEIAPWDDAFPARPDSATHVRFVLSAVALPDGIDAVTAASLSYAYGTVLHALRDRAALQPGETVLVLGAGGGAGMAALQVARIMGARVIAAASPPKHAACLAAGAAAVVDYTAEKWRDRIKALAPAGVEVVFDAVGGPYAEPALRSIGWRGRYLVVVFAAGEIPRIALNLALLKNCAITGVFYGEFVRREPANNRAMLARLFRWVADGQLVPAISHRFPLEGAGEALELLARRRAVGKLLLVTHAGQRSSV